MSSNNENLRNNNDQPPPDHDAGGNVLGPRTNGLTLNTDQPYKPVTASAGGTVQADSGYRTGSTSVTTPAFTTALAAPASAIPATPTSASATTSEAPPIVASPIIAPPIIARGRHARSDAQDLGTPTAAGSSPAKLKPIAEDEPAPSTSGIEHDARDAVLDKIDIMAGIAFSPVDFTPADTTPLRFAQHQSTTAERDGTSPVSPKTSIHPLKAHPTQPQGGQVLEGPGPHVPKHRKHQGSETAGILRSQKSLAKLDTTMDAASPKRPTFDNAAINKPHSRKEYPTTPAVGEKEGSVLKLKQKPLKVGMGQPIKQLAVKMRGKMTGLDEREREAQVKARKASADAKALHKEVTGAPTAMSKILHKVKSISTLRKQDDVEHAANNAESSKSASVRAGRTRSQWWPDWRQKSSKDSVDLSDEDEKSRKKKSQKALGSFKSRGSTTAKAPFNGVDWSRDYPPRPWADSKSSGPVGHSAQEGMFHHPDMRPGDDLTEKFYVSRINGKLTPLLLDKKKRPIRFKQHSAESSTATNWAKHTVSKVDDIGRSLMKASGRKVKSEADALDHTADDRVSSWRGRGKVESNRGQNIAGVDVASSNAVSPREDTHINGATFRERPRQPSGIHPIIPGEASEQESLSLCQFPSMPTESSTSYEQSVRTCQSAVEAAGDISQAPSVPVHDPATAREAVQPMSDISQAPSVPLHEPAPHRVANNLLMVPQTVGNHMLAVPGASSPPVRPSSTATDNVPSLMLDQSSNGSGSMSS